MPKPHAAPDRAANTRTRRACGHLGIYPCTDVGDLCADITLLRADFADEGKDLSDAAFIRDAWANGIREPYIKNRWVDDA